MKFTITRDMLEVDYESSAFWQQFDEVEVECPAGWHVRYVEGGMVHVFDYDQSSGRGEYCTRYMEDEHERPISFTTDPKANAELMRKTNYDFKKAKLIRKP